MPFRLPAPVVLMFLLVGCVAFGCDSGKATSCSAEEATEVAERTSAVDARDISFPITCCADTQASFDKGLFLLHNMMYRQAQAEFESAATADKTCAMLQWGIAMTQFHPVWPGGPSEEALKSGARAVEKARSIAATNSATTDREKEYIEAVAAYYKDWKDNDRGTRRIHWRDAQGKLAKMFPQDAEAQIFFALAQFTTTAPNDFEGQLRSAEQLEIILKERPEHPGVLHYLVHAYDNPKHAHRGVKTADAYDKVAPDSPHALHMPSHIYVRLGVWDQVIASNIRSRNSAQRQPVDGDRVSKHFLHALDYLVYGYLQVADDKLARQEVARANNETEWELNSGPGAYALAAIPARLAIERRAWQQAAKLKPRAISYTWDAYPWAEAITHAARGLGSARSGDIDAAQQAIRELDRLKALTTDTWWQGRIEVERDVVAGWVAHKQGKTDKAAELLSQAAKRELDAGKQPVEPGHTVYAVEQLGELLLKLNRPAEALKAFRLSLQDSPRRFHALFGAGRAAEIANMDGEAAAYYASLTEMVVSGGDRPQVRHAADFLARAKK